MDSSRLDFLTFELADRTFALPVPLVREVTRAVAIAALPRAPHIVEGVINLRGTILPVLDIRHRFGLAPCPLSPQQQFVVARAHLLDIVLRVDRAVGIVSVEPEAIAAFGAAAPGAEYVAGIVRLPDGLLVIYDLARFLSADESVAIGAAIAGTVPA